MRAVEAVASPAFAEGVNLTNLTRALALQGQASPINQDDLASDLAHHINSLTRFICFADSAFVPGLSDDVLMFAALKAGVLAYQPIEGGGQRLVAGPELDFAKLRTFALSLAKRIKS